MTENKYIILFDGECNFCSFWVKFVSNRDKNDLFRFAPLLSERGLQIRKTFNIGNKVDSVILIENDRAFIKSTAALRILKLLGGFYVIFLPTGNFSKIY